MALHTQFTISFTALRGCEQRGVAREREQWREPCSSSRCWRQDKRWSGMARPWRPPTERPSAPRAPRRQLRERSRPAARCKSRWILLSGKFRHHLRPRRAASRRAAHLRSSANRSPRCVLRSSSARWLAGASPQTLPALLPITSQPKRRQWSSRRGCSGRRRAVLHHRRRQVQSETDGRVTIQRTKRGAAFPRRLRPPVLTAPLVALLSLPPLPRSSSGPIRAVLVRCREAPRDGTGCRLGQ